MATRWYTAYKADLNLLKLLIIAAGIDIKTINEDELKYRSKNGFRSLERLLYEVMLPEEKILEILINELHKRHKNINRNAFVEAFTAYQNFVNEIDENELIGNLNELLKRFCSIEATDTPSILFKATYVELIESLLSQIMQLKVVAKEQDDKLLEFERMQNIINGLTNTLLELSSDDIMFLSECKQQMDIPNVIMQKDILQKLTKRFNHMGNFLYLIIAAEKLDAIDADKMFVKGECVIDTNGLSKLATELTIKLSSPSRNNSLCPEELLIKDFFSMFTPPDVKIIFEKSVGNHGKVPERESHFEVLYNTYVKQRSN